MTGENIREELLKVFGALYSRDGIFLGKLSLKIGLLDHIFICLW